MLQQTQVGSVIPYYERFIAEFPDVTALAAAPLERVLELWSGLGYYSRARNLHRAAATVVETHGGRFPRAPALLAELPGVGRSTAAAIAAFAFGVHAPILDGNVKRVLARHRAIEGYPGLPRVEKILWEAAAALLPPAGSRVPIGSYTQALMDLGSTVCTRTRPACLPCPVRGDCAALREDRVGELPAPRPTRVQPHRSAQLLVIELAGEILFERRPATGVWAGLWSLPEAEPGADIGAVLGARFGLEAGPAVSLEPIEHAFSHYRLTLLPLHIRVHRGQALAEDPGSLWLTPSDAIGAAVPAPIRRLLLRMTGAVATRPKRRARPRGGPSAKGPGG